MKTRVITAIAALIVFLPLLYVGGDYFKYTTFALGVMAMYEIVRMTFKETNIVVLGLSSLAGALLYLREEILGLSQYGIVYLLVIGMLGVVVVTGHRIKLVNRIDYICYSIYICWILFIIYAERFKFSTYRIFTTYYLVY